MKIDLSDEYISLIIEALEHRYAYSRAVQHEDARYEQAADWFKRKQPSTEPERTTRRKQPNAGGCEKIETDLEAA